MNLNPNNWDKIWNRKYEKYNRHHQEVWDNFVKEGVTRGNIVDLGCGPCVMYEGKSISLVGVDWSEGALKQARLHYPCGVYIQADARNTGLPSSQFDTVIMLGLLDYFDNWPEIINEAERLRKKDGRIFATLLRGFQDRKWTLEDVISHLNLEPKQYKRVAGPWILIEI